MKQSRLQRRQDDQLIHDLLAKNPVEYSESLNPFEEGTLRHERFARLYPRYRNTWLDTESRFEELCEVYGGV